MVELVENHEQLKKKTGRPSKLSLENQVLMTLEYLREYRTYFHIGQSWGLNESTVYRIITKIEEIFIKSSAFRLPGKKQLLKSSTEISVVVVDVTENPIERPKKNRKILQWKKRCSAVLGVSPQRVAQIVVLRRLADGCPRSDCIKKEKAYLKISNSN